MISPSSLCLLRNSEISLNHPPVPARSSVSRVLRSSTFLSSPRRPWPTWCSCCLPGRPTSQRKRRRVCASCRLLSAAVECQDMRRCNWSRASANIATGRLLLLMVFLLLLLILPLLHLLLITISQDIQWTIRTSGPSQQIEKM